MVFGIRLSIGTVGEQADNLGATARAVAYQDCHEHFANYPHEQHARFSNRPSGSSTFRLSTTSVSMSLTGSRFSSDSAPRALPSWDSKTRWNNLLGVLAVNLTAGSSGHTNSPHPSSRAGHHSTARWSSISSYRI